jgi:type VI secretion system (T6SS) effector TldE1-like protein
LIRRLSGAAFVCLIAGCGGVVYSNIFAANVYPTLGLSGYDDPIVRQPRKVATRNTAQAVTDAFAAFTEPVLDDKPTTVAAISPTMFNDRFGAAQPQGVASRAAEAAPQPLKLAEASKSAGALKPVDAPKAADTPKSAGASKVAEAPKSKEAAPVKVAMNVPPPAPAPVESAPAKSTGLSLSEMAQRAKAAMMSITLSDRQAMTEKLWGKPSSSGTLLSYASADASVTASIGQNQNPALGGSAPYERDTAVYDISAHMVYLPDGTKLEAHSGLGSELDDPRSARIRMRGVTPPHIYELKPREALFHGVPALRLNPIGGEDAIYGRSGLLAHTYMLGPNGDSNGCVSFKDYNAFLNAYHNQGIKKLAVVARIS